MQALEKMHGSLKTQLEKLKKENHADETHFMKDFIKVSKDYENNMNSYDNDVEM